MIEIVRAKAARAKQPFHVRVVAEGNDQPLLAGETLTGEYDAHAALVALGRLFSPVDHAAYAPHDSGGVLTVFLEDDDPEDPAGEHLHIPVVFVDLREAAEEEPAKPAPKPPKGRSAARKAAMAADSPVANDG